MWILAGSMSVAPCVKLSFERALRHAKRRQRLAIHPATLLLGMVEVEDAMSNLILRDLGIDLEQLARSLRGALVAMAPPRSRIRAGPFAWYRRECVGSTRTAMTDLNYYNTLIAVADDCPVDHSVVPPPCGGKPTVAVLQYEMLSGSPHTFTQPTRRQRGADRR